MRTQAEWKVDTTIAFTAPPTSPWRRSFISRAALLVKVIARTAVGGTPRSRTRWAIRWVSTRVLPDPAPATMRVGPSVASTARRWASFNPSSSSGEAWGSVGSGRAEAFIAGEYTAMPDGAGGAVHTPPEAHSRLPSASAGAAAKARPAWPVTLDSRVASSIGTTNLVDGDAPICLSASRYWRLMVLASMVLAVSKIFPR